MPVTTITNFETALERAAEIKAEFAAKPANYAALASHFGLGTSVNVATVLWLTDQISNKLGLSVTAATLAAAGFNLSHMILDYFQNRAAAEQLKSELKSTSINFTQEELAEFDKLFETTKLFPAQFYPYVQIMGMILFSGLNYASMTLPDLLPAAWLYVSSVALNFAAGGIFVVGGIPIKAGVPVAMAWAVGIANSLGLALAPARDAILNAVAGNPDIGKGLFTAAVGASAAAGAAIAKATAKPLGALLGKVWGRVKACRGSESGYAAVP